MTYEEYQVVKDFIYDKSLRLMKSQNKAFAKVGFPITNYTYLYIKGNYYYIAKTNPFKFIIDEVLLKAVEKFPEKFGTGCAKDVIEAIYNIDSVFFTPDGFIDFLRTEQFCYVVERTEQGLTEKILRIDLFRHLKINENGKFDFIGGLLHSMKHFSFNGTPLSTGNEINDIPYIEHLIVSIMRAFFSSELKVRKKENYTSLFELDRYYNLRVEFFYERETNVYFINTAFKVKKK